MNAIKTSIRHELFKNSVVLSVAILIVFGVLLSSILYFSELANAKALIRQRNQAVTYFIDGYFTKFSNSINFLSSNPNIINATNLSNLEMDKIRSLYQSLQSADVDINYIYSGYTDGSLLINNYVPPAQFDSTTRPWYKAAVKVQPDLSGGIPYQEIKSKEWLISISKILKSKNGNINGVVAIDCSMDTIANLLQQDDGYYKSSHSFATNTHGEIIIHNNNSHIGHKINDRFNTSVDINKIAGQFIFTDDGTRKLAYFTKVNQVGWVIITVVDLSEVLRPIIIKIIGAISTIAALATLLCWILSTSLSKRIITPLEELKLRVGNILTSNTNVSSKYSYPNNEIGTIAADIEELAEQKLYKKNQQLQNINQELILLSTTDQLTNLFNRRKMDSELESELMRSKRYNQPFSIIMFDIDWFKTINDSFGHQTGDQVLIDIATILRTTLRSSDIVSRWGGDEFMILCPQTNQNGAVTMAENIRVAIANYNFKINQYITISIGVSVFSDQASVADMLKEVDKKLYAAKHQGRNTVIV